MRCSRAPRRLSRVDIKRPAKVIGTNTVAHLQSGLYFGYIGLVDGILESMIAELGAKPRRDRHRRAGAHDRGRLALHQEIDDMLTLEACAFSSSAIALRSPRAPRALRRRLCAIIQLLHRDRRALSAAARIDSCCSRRSTGR